MKNIDRIIFTLAVLLAAAVSARAELSVRPPFTDGMVLQQQTDASIWGFASPGSKIKVRGSWMKKDAWTVAGEDSLWRVSLPTPKASYEPRTITVKGDGGKIVLSDVLIGEVWFGGGQSNMEMPMGGWHNCPVEYGREHIYDHPDDALRMYIEPKGQSWTPVREGRGQWIKASPKTTGRMSCTGYFFARQLKAILDVPVAVVVCAYGGTRVEGWIPESQMRVWNTEDLSEEGVMRMSPNHRPFLPYNAMLKPLAGYTVKGFLWYQGCSNVGYPKDPYDERMSWMISHWRELWGDKEAKLPFYMVEIAPFEYTEGPDLAVRIREQQHKAAKSTPNCGIVVTNDLVYEHERYNIHPQQKKPVGERLAFLALNRDYGYSEVVCYSPEFVRAFYPTQDRDCIGVQLTNCRWNGLDRTMGIKGLEICGEDGVWHEVPSADYYFADYLYIKLEEVPHPVAVRYGWANFAPGNLRSCEGLGVAPFYGTVQ